jgi:hypothetical protein
MSASDLLWTTLLVATCALLLGLTLLPALAEWYWPRDNQPLRVVRTHDGHIAHFAQTFRSFINERLGAEIARAQQGVELQRGELDDGVHFTVMGSAMPIPFEDAERAARESAELIVARYDLEIPGGWIMATEIFGMRGAKVGARTALRAILVDDDVDLEEGCQVLRWAHARGSVRAGRNCHFPGRVSADGAIEFAGGCSFARVAAPEIRFVGGVRLPPRSAVSRSPLAVPVRHTRTLHDASFETGGDEFHPGDIIARGSIRLGANNRVAGSLKAHNALELGDGTRVLGAVIAGGVVQIGADCVIGGPIVSEAEVDIAGGAVLGTLDAPLTITAPRIRIACGVRVCGTIWARELGQVRA